MVAEPDRHDWRVVDAAYDRLTCRECGERLSRGPAGCAACDLAHGFRYAAIETDRPGVPPGNEHAVRVNAQRASAALKQSDPAQKIRLLEQAVEEALGNQLP